MEQAPDWFFAFCHTSVALWVSEAEILVVVLSLSSLPAAPVNKKPGTSKNIADAFSQEHPVELTLWICSLLSFLLCCSRNLLDWGGLQVWGKQVLVLGIFWDRTKPFAAWGFRAYKYSPNRQAEKTYQILLLGTAGALQFKFGTQAGKFMQNTYVL